MPEIKTLPLATPDFDLNRNRLKEFMKNHPQFKDYDFDGSNLAHLLDVLALNTYTNAFFLNQVGNESTLTTGFKRESVANRALDLGYVARNVRAASITIQMELFATNGDGRIDIPVGTVFSALNSDYKFITVEEVPVFKQNGRFLTEVTAYEGKLLTHRYTFTEEGNYSGDFVIPNPNVDDSKVRVYVTDGVSRREYQRSDKIIGVGPQDNVYFLKYRDGIYFIEFGDGVLGAKPEESSQVEIQYLVSSGSIANNLKNFSIVSQVPGTTASTSFVQSASSGGLDPEKIEQIKSNAKKSFRTQDAAITASDFEVIATREMSYIEDCIAYGGEEATPKRYGAVYITPTPRTGIVFSDEQKNVIKRTLQKFAIAGTNIIILDPDFLYYHVSTIVSYDKNLLVGTEASLVADVQASIEAYYQENLTGDKREFNRSVIQRYIDTASPSIISNKFGYYMEKKQIVSTETLNNITVSFPVVGCEFSSSSFSTDGQNVVTLQVLNGSVLLVDSAGTIVQDNIGTFDGQTLQVKSLRIVSTTTQDQATGKPNISIYVRTAEQDILNDGKSFSRIIIDSISVVGE